MSVSILRGLIDGNSPEGSAPTVELEEWAGGPPGMPYVCRRCEVYGYLGPGEALQCWACEAGDRIERR